MRMLCRLACVMGQQGIGILTAMDDGQITGAMLIERDHRQVQLPPLSERERTVGDILDQVVAEAVRQLFIRQLRGKRILFQVV